MLIRKQNIEVLFKLKTVKLYWKSNAGTRVPGKNLLFLIQQLVTFNLGPCLNQWDRRPQDSWCSAMRCKNYGSIYVFWPLTIDQETVMCHCNSICSKSSQQKKCVPGKWWVFINAFCGCDCYGKRLNNHSISHIAWYQFIHNTGNINSLNFVCVDAKPWDSELRNAIL